MTSNNENELRDEINRLRAELETVRQSEKRFLDALRLSPMALCHHDTDLRYTWLYNGHMGFVQKDVIGKTDWDILDKDLADRMGEIKRRVLKTGVGERVEMPSDPSDENGEYFDLIVEPMFDDNSGDVSGLCCSGIDVTQDRRRREAYRAAEERAALALKAKSQFIAAASHDLRQPLQAVGLNLALLESYVEDPKGKQVLERISMSFEAMNDMFNGILDISKLDAHAIECRPVPVSISDVWERMEIDFLPQSYVQGVDLSFVPCSETVECDPVQLDRLLRNLISNALRYTQEGRILVGCRRHQNKIGLYVYDTGIGISLEDQQFIFQDFWQVGNPQRDRRQGLGLGLAISERIAHLMETEIHVRSQLGRGSVFWFDLPRSDDQRRATDPDEKVASRIQQGKMVLLVEDEIDVRMATQTVLEAWGYQVMAADGLVQARQVVAQARCYPDIVLADYRLGSPDQTGINVITALRKESGREIPAIVLTGDTSKDLVSQLRGLRIPLLSKPVSPSQLRDQLETELCASL